MHIQLRQNIQNCFRYFCQERIHVHAASDEKSFAAIVIRSRDPSRCFGDGGPVGPGTPFGTVRIFPGGRIQIGAAQQRESA